VGGEWRNAFGRQKKIGRKRDLREKKKIQILGLKRTKEGEGDHYPMSREGLTGTKRKGGRK